jgi:hypothetical protein
MLFFDNRGSGRLHMRLYRRAVGVAQPATRPASAIFLLGKKDCPRRVVKTR